MALQSLSLFFFLLLPPSFCSHQQGGRDCGRGHRRHPPPAAPAAPHLAHHLLLPQAALREGGCQRHPVRNKIETNWNKVGMRCGAIRSVLTPPLSPPPSHSPCREDAPAPESRPSSRHSSLRSVLGYRTHTGVYYSPAGSLRPGGQSQRSNSTSTNGGVKPPPLQYDHRYGYPV